LQLAGSPERSTLDINALGALGIDVVGRFASMRDDTALFSGSLGNVCALADLKMNRLLDTIDQWVRDFGMESRTDSVERFDATRIDQNPRLDINLKREGFDTVLWATGYRPDYSWLDVPVLDRKGRILHDGGVTHAPGLYVMGLPFLRRRKSTLIDGAGYDARDLARHLAAHIGGNSLAA
ncbi:MAG: pyridine nucleotide-disulfide oxidoreductase, partial [Pseudomonadota bacterium]